MTPSPSVSEQPRTVPFAYREKLMAELELLQQQGIIAPVTTPTEWCVLQEGLRANQVVCRSLPPKQVCT
jgi:hypothetical protein